MAGPFVGDRPFLTIGDKTFESPIVWDWFLSVKMAGGILMISDQDPLYSFVANYGDGDSRVYPSVWARRFDPSETITGGHLWIWAMMPGRDFGALGGNLAQMLTHENIVPIYATPTDKLTGIEINGQSVTLFGPWSGDGKFWRDFAVAAVVATAVAVTAGSILPGVPSTVAGASGASGIATAAPAVSATPWEIATAGMAEGMGTGGTIAATSGGILSTAQTVGGSVVSGARAVAGAATVTRAAIDTIQAAANGTPQSTSNTPPQPANNSALLILGLAALLLT